MCDLALIGCSTILSPLLHGDKTRFAQVKAVTQQATYWNVQQFAQIAKSGEKGKTRFVCGADCSGRLLTRLQSVAPLSHEEMTLQVAQS